MQIGLTLDADVIAAMDSQAAEERLNRSAWLNRFLAKHLLGNKAASEPVVEEEPVEPAGKPRKRK